MIPTISHSLTLIASITLLLFTTTSASPHHHASPLCRNSDTPLLCRRISARIPVPNPITITAAAITEAIAVATEAKAKAASLAASGGLSPRQKSGFEACGESYGDVVDGLRDGVRLLGTSRRRADVMNYLSAASFGVTECEEVLSEMAGGELQMARVNRKLRKYVSNALAMGDQLGAHW